MYSYSVFGGDARQTYLAKLLEQAGFPTVHTADTVRFSDVVILPVPTVTPEGFLRGTKLPFDALLRAAPTDTTFWGTGFGPYQALAGELQIRLCDFNAYETFAAQNAGPTAEGALQIAMEELPTTIENGRFLVIGYGRIGSRLAAMLHDLGGAVTVARREPSSLPYAVDQTGNYRLPLSGYDAVFNTVPKPVFTKAHCQATKEDCLLIDLASAPGGIAKDCGRRLIHALGLPAKVAPKTAAGIMQSIILSETEE